MVAPNDLSRQDTSSMHSFYLETHVVTPSVPPPGRTVRGKKPRVDNSWHTDGFTDKIAHLQNRVTDKQLNILLDGAGVRKSNVSERYLRNLHGWKLPIDLCTVRFSARLSAVWVHHRDAVVFFANVDREYIVFALRRSEHLSVAQADGKRRYPELRLPAHGVHWTALQQMLVESFEDDDTVRAMSAAAMICCAPSGDYSGVARNLLPSKLRTVRAKVIYDSPVDEDMVSVLADAYEYNGRLIFKSGGGHVVESSMKGSMAVLRRRDAPLKLRPFEERHNLLMPFLYY